MGCSLIESLVAEHPDGHPCFQIWYVAFETDEEPIRIDDIMSSEFLDLAHVAFACVGFADVVNKKLSLMPRLRTSGTGAAGGCSMASAALKACNKA